MNDPHARADIGCLKAIELFYEYLDGELDGVSASDMEHHLEHCRGCYTRAEFEGLLTVRLEAVAAAKAPDALRARLRHLMNEF